MNQTRLKVFGLLLFVSMTATAAEEQRPRFEGSWCRNSCLYGSAGNGPPHLPCQIDIGRNSLSWDWGKRHLERRYTVLEQTARSATLILEGGDDVTWYALKSKHQTRWRLLIEAPTGVDAFGDMVLLSSEPYCEGKNSCGHGQGETLQLSRRSGACS